MNFIPEAINTYIEKYYDTSDPMLQAMDAHGSAQGFPFVGPQVGHLLWLLTKTSGAKRIFEMGSGFGYSAYWFAKALPSDGKVYLTEKAQENIDLATDYFSKAGLSSNAEFLVGNALDLIDQVEGPFDIVFLDLNKPDYPLAFMKAKERLRPGGLLIADNTLWSGRVIEETTDKQTLGIQKFTELLFNDKDFFASILPIRDGVAVAYKNNE